MKSRYLLLVASKTISTVRPRIGPGSGPPMTVCAQPRVVPGVCLILVRSDMRSSTMFRFALSSKKSPGVTNESSQSSFDPCSATVATSRVRVVR